jgi:hypothetical protein
MGLIVATRFGINSTSLYYVDVQKGSTSLLFHLPNKEEEKIVTGYPVLSRNGKSLFFLESDYAKMVVRIMKRDLETSKDEVVKVFDNAPRITGLSISPDDKQLAFVWYRPYEKNAPSSIYVLSLTDGGLKELYKAEDWNDGTKFEGVEWSPDGRYVYVVMPLSPGEQGSVASLVCISTESGDCKAPH